MALHPVRIGQILLHGRALQRLHVKEPEGGNIVRRRSDIELALFPQVNLIAPDVVRPQMIEPLLSVTAEILDGVQIAADG
jgi:hypothetical protein